MGHAPADAATTAMGLIYQTLRTQAPVLAYADVFWFCAILAFAVAPFALLFTQHQGQAPGARPRRRTDSVACRIGRYGQRTSGGRLIRIASTLPPVFRPNSVPRSWIRLNST